MEIEVYQFRSKWYAIIHNRSGNYEIYGEGDGEIEALRDLCNELEAGRNDKREVKRVYHY